MHLLAAAVYINAMTKRSLWRGPVGYVGTFPGTRTCRVRNWPPSRVYACTVRYCGTNRRRYRPLYGGWDHRSAATCAVCGPGGPAQS